MAAVDPQLKITPFKESQMYGDRQEKHEKLTTLKEILSSGNGIANREKLAKTDSEMLSCSRLVV